MTGFISVIGRRCLSGNRRRWSGHDSDRCRMIADRISWFEIPISNRTTHRVALPTRRTRRRARQGGWSNYLYMGRMRLSGKRPRVRRWRSPGMAIRIADITRLLWKNRTPPITMLPPVFAAFMALIDPNSTVTPVEVVHQPKPRRIPGAKGEVRFGIKSGAIHIDDLGIITRNIDDIRLSGHDADVIPIHDHLLLRCRGERADASGLSAPSLNRLHHFSGLRGECFAQLFGPREIFVHPFYHFRIVGERFRAVVPWLVVDFSGLALCFAVTRGHHDIRSARPAAPQPSHHRPPT